MTNISLPNLKSFQLRFQKKRQNQFLKRKVSELSSYLYDLSIFIVNCVGLLMQNQMLPVKRVVEAVNDIKKTT